MIPVNVISGGSAAFNALLYPDNAVLNSYFSNEIDTLKQYGNIVSDGFINTSRNIYDRYKSSNVVDIAKNALRKAFNITRQDSIISYDIDNVFDANLRTQRLIMAEPSIRTLNNLQLCNGYGETYVDVDPSAQSPEDHYDYHRVMDGVMLDKDTCWQIKFYSDDVDPEDVLTSHEKHTILDNWRIAINAKLMGKDPTDPLRGDL